MVENLRYTTTLSLDLGSGTCTIYEIRVDFTFTTSEDTDRRGRDSGGAVASVEITGVWVIGSRTKIVMGAPSWIEDTVRQDPVLEASLLTFGEQYSADKQARLAGYTHTVIVA